MEQRAISGEFKILIVEDEPLVAEHISRYLNSADFIVSGIAHDDEEARHLLKTFTPDAIILDINLDGDTDGIQLADFINKQYHLPFLFLTSYADRDTLERAKKVEPWGYIVKPFNEKTIQASLEIAISNFAQRSNQIVPTLQMEKINRHLLTHITPREFEVLELIYSGHTNQQIADLLFVSLNTIKRHINNAYLSLNVSSRGTVIARLRELMLK
ncbi:MAG: response regulator transcription factor [Saprospiraceae bacterium]